MRLVVRTLSLVLLSFTFWIAAGGQTIERDLKLAPGGSIHITNLSGRVGIRAVAAAKDKPFQPRLEATGTGISDSDIKSTSSGGHAAITVPRSPEGRRVDLVVTLPERTALTVQTEAGAIDIQGNLASVDARSDTGTISADVPTDDLRYRFTWTESRPRYLADFDIAKVKERSGGRFEIQGDHHDDSESKPKTSKDKTDDDTENVRQAVSLNFTTARGIILLNVPPNEVMSDLRERPLTNAAKAIIRSGDSLLMEAIRRAAPKYFSDYARTLPPFSREPGFATKGSRLELPAAQLKMASVRVTDLKSRSLAGLGAADFEVTENGHKREIVSVEQSTAPFNLVLLLDVSGSVENYVNFIRKAARSFVNTVDKNDRVAIVIFNDDVKVVSRFTTDKAKLSESLDTFDAGGATAYYDALAYTIADTIRSLKGERSAIVILTDGEDNRSFLSFDSMAGSIQESGALIYPLYVPSGLIAAAAAGADIDPLRKKYMSLSARSEGEGEKLAKISGGVYYPITEIGQIQRAYEDIVVQLRSAYNITFRSDMTVAGGNGASPRLKISAKRNDTFTTITSVVAREEK